MGKKVSVIVPIFKVEQYLEECLNSLINQSYRNIEIILVDDGSPDSCAEICNRYAATDGRILVIHKENGGLSDARNAGLDKASGEYVLFIDSDDYVADDMVKKLYALAENNSADIAVCYFQRVYEDGYREAIVEPTKIKELYNPKDLLKELYTTRNSPIAFVAWNKLYKRSLFMEHDIRYPKGKYHEDTFITYRLLYHATSVAVVKEPLYFYRIRGGSIMTEGISEKRLDNLEAMRGELEFYRIRGEKELSTMALNRYCKVSIELYNKISNIHNKKRSKEQQNEMYLEYKQVWSQYGNYAELPLIKRIVYGSLCNKLVGSVLRLFLGVRENAN